MKGTMELVFTVLIAASQIVLLEAYIGYYDYDTFLTPYFPANYYREARAFPKPYPPDGNKKYPFDPAREKRAEYFCVKYRWGEYDKAEVIMRFKHFYDVLCSLPIPISGDVLLDFEFHYHPPGEPNSEFVPRWDRLWVDRDCYLIHRDNIPLNTTKQNENRLIDICFKSRPLSNDDVKFFRKIYPLKHVGQLLSRSMLFL